jgi:hypothetical protein
VTFGVVALSLMLSSRIECHLRRLATLWDDMSAARDVRSRRMKG